MPLRLLLPLLVLALLLAGSPPSRAEGERVVARLDWEPERLGSIRSGRIPFRTEPIKGVHLPTTMTSPRYARISMADTGGLDIAFDANASGPRLWVDSDGDRDLKEEKKHRMRKVGSTWQRIHRILIKYKGEQRPRPVEMVFQYLPQNGVDYVRVWAQAHRRGYVVLAGRLRLVALTDGRANLRFNEPEYDTLYVDIDGDGEVGSTSQPYERLKLGEPFRVGDEGWIATVPTASGRVVEFERADKVPPAHERTWKRRSTMKPGAKQSPPSESLDVLAKRFEQERNANPISKRYATIQQMGRVGSDNAFRLLQRIAANRSENSAVRGYAVRAIGNPAFLASGGDYLLKLARSNDTATQSAAVQALFTMGHPKRVEIFKGLLEISDTQQSSAISTAASYLGYEGTDEARAALTQALRNHALPQGRYYAYNGLRNLPEGPTVKDMLAAVEVDYVTLRSNALADLFLLDHPKAPAVARELSELRPVNTTVGQTVARVLGAAGDPKSVEALLEMLAADAVPGAVASEAVKQLRFLRAPDAIKVILGGLKSKQPVVRKTAAQVLALLPEEHVTKALMKRAKREKDLDVLAALCEALGLHESPEARSVLLKYAKSRKDGVRGPAIRALARLGFEDERIQKFFVGLLTSRRWEDRVLAIDAAASSHSGKFLSGIIKNLDFKAWQVRLAAVEALEKLRLKEGIPALIEQLAKEEVGRIRKAIARALHMLTHQNLYENAKTWRAWWKQHGATFEVPEMAPDMVDKDIGGTSAGFYGIPVDTERVVFVIDQSGSMSAAGLRGDQDEDNNKNRLQIAVQEVLKALDQLPKAARANVVLFHTTIHPWEDKLVKLSSANRSKLRNHLTRQNPTGGTNLYDGIEAALQMEDVDTIFVLSDGAPGAGKYTQPRDILRGIRGLNQVRRIAIHCVSIGMDSDLMRNIARENGGKYVTR